MPNEGKRLLSISLELNMYPFTEAGLSEKEAAHIQSAKEGNYNGSTTAMFKEEGIVMKIMKVLKSTGGGAKLTTNMN